MNDTRAEPTVVYAIPDLHGHLGHLRAALDLVDLDDPGTQLVLLGDYIDRGPDSAGVLELVRAVQEEHPRQVIALLGNHEVDFLDWLDGQDAIWLLSDPDLQITRSFLPVETVEDALAELVASERHGLADPGVVERVNAAVKREISDRHGDLIEWLRRQPLHHETTTHIYVHAGLDEETGNLWKQTTPEEMFTHKYPPSFGTHPIGKIIVAGHVGTPQIHPDGTCGPYVDTGHVYLDGSVETTGQLNLMRYDAATGRTTFHTITDEEPRR